MNKKNTIIIALGVIIIAMGTYIFVSQKAPVLSSGNQLSAREIFDANPKISSSDPDYQFKQRGNDNLLTVYQNTPGITECLQGNYIQGGGGIVGDNTEPYENFFLNTDQGKDFLNTIGLVYCGDYSYRDTRGDSWNFYVYTVTNENLENKVKTDAIESNPYGQYIIAGGDLYTWLEQQYSGKTLGNVKYGW